MSPSPPTPCVSYRVLLFLELAQGTGLQLRIVHVHAVAHCSQSQKRHAELPDADMRCGLLLLLTAGRGRLLPRHPPTPPRHVPCGPPRGSPAAGPFQVSLAAPLVSQRRRTRVAPSGPAPLVSETRRDETAGFIERARPSPSSLPRRAALPSRLPCPVFSSQFHASAYKYRHSGAPGLDKPTTPPPHSTRLGLRAVPEDRRTRALPIQTRRRVNFSRQLTSAAA